VYYRQALTKHCTRHNQRGAVSAYQPAIINCAGSGCVLPVTALDVLVNAGVIQLETGVIVKIVYFGGYTLLLSILR